MIRADGFVCSASVQDESEQIQFAPLKVSVSNLTYQLHKEGADQKVCLFIPFGLLTPANVRLRPLLGALCTSGAVPSGLFSHPHSLVHSQGEGPGKPHHSIPACHRMP